MTENSTGRYLTVRVSSALYADALERAAADEQTLSGLVRLALRRHLQAEATTIATGSEKSPHCTSQRSRPKVARASYRSFDEARRFAEAALPHVHNPELRALGERVHAQMRELSATAEEAAWPL